MEYVDATLVEKQYLGKNIVLTFKVVIPSYKDEKWELGGLYPIDIDDKL